MNRDLVITLNFDSKSSREEERFFYIIRKLNSYVQKQTSIQRDRRNCESIREEVNSVDIDNVEETIPSINRLFSLSKKIDEQSLNVTSFDNSFISSKATFKPKRGISFRHRFLNRDDTGSTLLEKSYLSTKMDTCLNKEVSKTRQTSTINIIKNLQNTWDKINVKESIAEETIGVDDKLKIILNKNTSFTEKKTITKKSLVGLLNFALSTSGIFKTTYDHCSNYLNVK